MRVDIGIIASAVPQVLQVSVPPSCETAHAPRAIDAHQVDEFGVGWACGIDVVYAADIWAPVAAQEAMGVCVQLTIGCEGQVRAAA